MKRKDLLWALAYPVYQIIGTIRHEGSHALAAMAEGAKVTKSVFWPNFHLGGLQWRYASWVVGATTWFTIATPYFCDLITVFVALLIILEVRPPRRWLWLNLLIIGVVSPLVNSAYNYSGGLRGSFNDVGVLLRDLNPVAVHLYFVSPWRSTLGGSTTAIFAERHGIQRST
jgi:hypothetical protein